MPPREARANITLAGPFIANTMQWASTCLAILGVAAATLGIGLLLPENVRRSIQDHALLRVLDRPWRVERYVFRHHRLFGCAVIGSALAFLAILNTSHDRIAKDLSWQPSFGFRVGLMGTYALAGFFLIIGIYMAVRPSALKRFEAVANRWIDPVAAIAAKLSPLQKKPIPLLSFAPRQIGLLLLLVGIFCLLAAVRTIIAG